MNIYEHIRNSRIYSYIMTGITVYWLSEALYWIYSLDMNAISTQAVGLATAVLTALVALVKFTYTFAAHKPTPDKQE